MGPAMVLPQLQLGTRSLGPLVSDRATKPSRYNMTIRSEVTSTNHMLRVHSALRAHHVRPRLEQAGRRPPCASHGHAEVRVPWVQAECISAMHSRGRTFVSQARLRLRQPRQSQTSPTGSGTSVNCEGAHQDSCPLSCHEGEEADAFLSGRLHDSHGRGRARSQQLRRRR